jgi:hypothetical protein
MNDDDGLVFGHGEKLPPASAFGPSRPRRINLGLLFVHLFTPWFLFCVLYSITSFRIHYKAPGYARLSLLVGVAIAAMQGILASRAKQQQSWYTYGAFSCAAATILAAIAGDLNFTYNMQPLYTIEDLNVYPSINPAQKKGAQLMDAGRIYFAKGTGLDMKRAMGFKNFELFCVAPIVHGSGKMASYDFWAVGKDCCSSVASDFRCGEFNNPQARAGLRLLSDDERPYYKLAVQQAEAAYGIKSTHPLFFHWMQDPMSATTDYHDAGVHYFFVGMMAHFAFNGFCVAASVFIFTRAFGVI